MHAAAFIAPSYDTNKNFSYHLSVQIDLDGLSFCVVDTPTDQCVVLKNIPIDPSLSNVAWENALEKVLKEEPTLRGPWKQVRILWVSRKSLMIPSSVFRKEDLKSYLVLHQMLDEFDEIQHIKLNQPDSWAVFPIPSSVTNILSQHFPGALYYHQLVPFIESLFRKKKEELTDGIHINIHYSFFEYAVIRENKLDAYNSFQWKDENDILYYVLYLFRQFEFGTKTNTLTVYGKILETDNVKNLLQKYISQIHMSVPDERLQLPIIQNISVFTNLLNLYFCES